MCILSQYDTQINHDKYVPISWTQVYKDSVYFFHQMGLTSNFYNFNTYFVENNTRYGFLDHENLLLDTNFAFLTQILMKL